MTAQPVFPYCPFLSNGFGRQAVINYALFIKSIRILSAKLNRVTHDD